MKLLLISNSTNAGEEYLRYPLPEIGRFLDGVREAVFVPYAAVTFSYAEYERRVQARFAELGIRVRSQDTEFARLTHSVDSADETETYYHLFFFVRAYEGTPRIMEPDKSAALEWFDLDRLPDGMVPALRSDVGELMRGVVYGERIEPHCELNPADAVQEAADDDVLAASEKLLQRNAYVYEELAK